MIFLPDCPFKGPGSLPKFLALTPGCIMQNAVARFEGTRNSVYTNLYGIPRNSAELNSKKFRGITRNFAELNQFRIKFRIPRNSKMALPKTPYLTLEAMKREAMIYIYIHFQKNSYILVQFSEQCQSNIVVFAFTLHCCMEILAITHAVITMKQ